MSLFLFFEHTYDTIDSLARIDGVHSRKYKMARFSRRKPNLFTIDISAYKNFKIAKQNVQFFVRVFNLLDAKNPVNIFGDTGDAEYTLQLTQAYMADENWFVHPEFFSEPRNIQIGTKISLN